MFVHWSNTETTYRDMEKIEGFCNRCQSTQIHTFRLYEQKTKHYSAFSIGANHQVTSICHTCLLESALPKNEEALLIRKYKKLLLCQEGYELTQNGKTDGAIKKFKKVLKEDPDHPQALYGLAKGLISLQRYSEAEPFVAQLSNLYPQDGDVAEMRTILETKLTG